MSLTPTPSTVTQTVTILPGQEFVLPNGANIISIIASGDATAESDCTLPDLSEYACSYIKLVVDKDNNPNHPFDEESTTISYLKVGDTVFDFNDQLIVNGEDPGVAFPLATYNSYITDLALFKFTNVTQSNAPEKRSYIWLYFQTPASLIPTIEMQVKEHSNPVYFKAGPTAIECGEYPNP
jgi:hypothetical protein